MLSISDINILLDCHPARGLPEEFTPVAKTYLPDLEIRNLPSGVQTRNIIEDFREQFAVFAPYANPAIYAQGVIGAPAAPDNIIVKMEQPLNAILLINAFAEALNLELERKQLAYIPGTIRFSSPSGPRFAAAM